MYSVLRSRLKLKIHTQQKSRSAFHFWAAEEQIYILSAQLNSWHLSGYEINA